MKSKRTVFWWSLGLSLILLLLGFTFTDPTPRSGRDGPLMLVDVIGPSPPAASETVPAIGEFVPSQAFMSHAIFKIDGPIIRTNTVLKISQTNEGWALPPPRVARRNASDTMRTMRETHPGKSRLRAKIRRGPRSLYSMPRGAGSMPRA